MPQILFAHVHAIAYETDAKNNQIMIKDIPNVRMIIYVDQGILGYVSNVHNDIK